MPTTARGRIATNHHSQDQS